MCWKNASAPSYRYGYGLLFKLIPLTIKQVLCVIVFIYRELVDVNYVRTVHRVCPS